MVDQPLTPRAAYEGIRGDMEVFRGCPAGDRVLAALPVLLECVERDEANPSIGGVPVGYTEDLENADPERANAKMWEASARYWQKEALREQENAAALREKLAEADTILTELGWLSPKGDPVEGLRRLREEKSWYADGHASLKAKADALAEAVESLECAARHNATDPYYPPRKVTLETMARDASAALRAYREDPPAPEVPRE